MSDPFDNHSLSPLAGHEPPASNGDLRELTGPTREETARRELYDFLERELVKADGGSAALDAHMFQTVDNQYAINIGSVADYTTLVAPTRHELYRRIEEFLSAS